MSDGPELPPRPAPPRRLSDVVVPWLNWFGPGRVVAIIVMVGVVGAGAYWLVRAPVPPAEAGLPFAAASSADSTTSAVVVPGVTLPPPVAAPQLSIDVETAVVVHVAGAVVASGVYRLTGDARVHRAIEAAGGATSDADLDGLNLAAPVVDGQRIYVPVLGEVDPASVPELPAAAPTAAGEIAGPIDLNVATAAQLETLPGVGPSTANAIVDDRDRNGPFASVDDLDRVAGIGPAKLAAIRDLVTV
jgi:competence protein ComEA